jgi:hypothetical protein
MTTAGASRDCEENVEVFLSPRETSREPSVIPPAERQIDRPDLDALVIEDYCNQTSAERLEQLVELLSELEEEERQSRAEFNNAYGERRLLLAELRAASAAHEQREAELSEALAACAVDEERHRGEFDVLAERVAELKREQGAGGAGGGGGGGSVSSGSSSRDSSGTLLAATAAANDDDDDDDDDAPPHIAADGRDPDTMPGAEGAVAEGGSAAGGAGPGEAAEDGAKDGAKDGAPAPAGDGNAQGAVATAPSPPQAAAAQQADDQGGRLFEPAADEPPPADPLARARGDREVAWHALERTFEAREQLHARLADSRAARALVAQILEEGGRASADALNAAAGGAGAAAAPLPSSPPLPPRRRSAEAREQHAALERLAEALREATDSRDHSLGELERTVMQRERTLARIAGLQHDQGEAPGMPIPSLMGGGARAQSRTGFAGAAGAASEVPNPKLKGASREDMYFDVDLDD